jgi:hypothetical protein
MLLSIAQVERVAEVEWVVRVVEKGGKGKNNCICGEGGNEETNGIPWRNGDAGRSGGKGVDGAVCLIKEDLVIPKRNQRNWKEKLAFYGMDENSINLEDLIVRSNQFVRIKSGESLYESGVVKLRPKSIDDLKKWIGMDKSIKLSVTHEYVRVVDNVGTPLVFDRKKLLGLNLNKLLRAYLFDDPYKYVQIKDLLDRAANTHEIGTIHYNDIRIEENGILEIDRDINLMNVNRLYIEKGGVIRILARVFKLDALLLYVSD